MGDVSVGDVVFDERGECCNVLAVSEVQYDRPCYEIEFSDGETIVADESHLWLTWNAKERFSRTRRSDEWREKRRAKRPSRSTVKRPDLTERNRHRTSLSQLPVASGSVRSTAEIAATLHVDGGKRTNHSVNVALPLQLPDRDLPIDPYVLGVWLGDGGSYSAQITSADQEVVDNITACGVSIHKLSAKYNWGTHGLHRPLRLLGLLQNKHVPHVYLRASVSQRLSLLQGLMDTDGYADEAGACEFTTTSERLRDEVGELLCSLGIKSRLMVGRATLNGRDIGPKYRYKFLTDLPAFRLSRKLIRQKRHGFRGIHSVRFIQRATRVDSVPVKCIAVSSSSHLYLAGRGMIPTHNSDALLMAALQYVHDPRYSALILRRTYADLSLPGAIMDRAKEWLVPKGINWNDKDKRFTFPSGATLSFGYLDTDKDRFRYQGAELQFLAFDELTQFPEQWYRYLLSRLRRAKGSEVPIRVRSATNPGGIGHEWVKRRFIEGDGTRAFIPAALTDNPHLDADEYRQALAQLDPTTRRQLLEGIWMRDSNGLVYQHTEANVISEPPEKIDYYVLGLDYGFTDATAFTIVGWRDNDPCVYILRSYKKTGLTPSQAAEEVNMLSQNTTFGRMVGDIGGLGKGYVEEARSRFSLPIEAAEKNNKRGYISLFNGALDNKTIKIVRGGCQQLLDEWAELPWTEDRSGECDGFDNHCSDSALYSWRACPSYAERVPDKKPDYGTPEWHQAQEAAFLERDNERAERERRQQDDFSNTENWMRDYGL